MKPCTTEMRRRIQTCEISKRWSRTWDRQDVGLWEMMGNEVSGLAADGGGVVYPALSLANLAS